MLTFWPFSTIKHLYVPGPFACCFICVDQWKLFLPVGTLGRLCHLIVTLPGPSNLPSIPLCFQITLSKSERRNIEKMYNKMTIEELINQFPGPNETHSLAVSY